ncbi:MAG: GNAT family N-acetyltransferase [Marinilabiliaceae bacterium]
MEFCLRPATVADAEELLAIYAPYVTGTAVTFEYVVPSVSEFAERIRHTLASYPYIVAQSVADGSLLGYAYAGRFKERAAYQYACETSIYVRRDARGHRVGEALLTELENRLIARGVKSICACITYVQVVDPYLTNASMAFHERMGYRLVAHFHRSGFKFGRWYDMIWMEKLV